jgi:hypothetical protein
MNKHEWKDEALCLDYDTNIFFEKYEDQPELRFAVDKLCHSCPVRTTCFAVGVTGKEYGIWGGIYLEDGKISKEFNRHKTKAMWGSTWQVLTTSGDE